MKKILIIEDNADIRENTVELLELSGFEVFAANNGTGGIEVALQHSPDLIICDIMMPVVDGYGVLDAVQQNDSIRNTPFIFLTALTERSEITRGMQQGAHAYVTKPFEDSDLLAAIEQQLSKIEFAQAGS